jgi:UDP-glucose 4-epimerase
MYTILVTGGCGYLGSHTLVDLINNGYNVISVDNNSRSTERLLNGVKEITGKNVKNYKIDLCNYANTQKIFAENKIDGIIHFAAYKSVDESVKDPLLYFENNFFSQINLMRCAKEYNTSFFVFSSSCSVYGNINTMPVTEDTVLKKAESPYGMTKQVGEDMIHELAKTCTTRFVLLRYFNPVGAHPSALIGEIPFGKPSNLVPAITQFAAAKLTELKIFGTDYDTRDGSCIRDFVHVCDIAHAHTLALNYAVTEAKPAVSEIFNLGTGIGFTVLEAIGAFEKVTGFKLNYQIVSRRPGDIVAIYANNDKAKKILKWVPKYNIEDMMKTAWQWELKLMDN